MKSDLDILLEEEMNDTEFSKAWEETELEDQIKRMMIEARISNNMTQKQLAEKSGIRQSNISRIENGACLPTLSTLYDIAKGLGKKLRIEMV